MEPHLGAITENIAFLASLKHGGQAKTYPIPLRPCNSNKFIPSLTFKHEMVIAKAFALILVNTNDKSKVGAVCVEERVDHNGVIIRSATNSGSQKERQSAFACIAESLEHLSDSPNHKEQQNELLFEMVRVCQKKILGRLRSRHAPQTNKTKPPLLHKLQHGLDILKRYDHHSRLHDNLEKKAGIVINLLGALERLEQAQALGREGSECIQGIILGVQALLPQILESRKWLSTVKAETLQHVEHVHLENVVERLQKLDQYRHAAMNLQRLTRRYRILRNIQFEVVTMPNCPAEVKSMDLFPSDRGLFSQFHARQHVDHGRPPSFPCTPETYQKIFPAARQEGRVHAEIQLLCFYESMESCSGIIRPRVICSEKHACFLCDMFIRAHAQFYTPSTHGKIYPRWRLPKPGEFKISGTKIMAALHRFNSSLEEEIMARLLHGPQPNLSVPESVLVEAETLTPSLRSSGYAHDQAQTSDDTPATGELSHVPTINKHKVGSIAKLYENATLVSKVCSTTDSGRSTSSTSTILALDHTSEDYCIIQHTQSEQVIVKIFPGQNLTTYLSSDCMVQVHTPYIHLHLEYASIAPKSRAKLGSDLVLRLTCAVRNMDITEDACPPSTWIDLGARSDSFMETLPENALFTEGGITLCKHDHFVTLRALEK